MISSIIKKMLSFAQRHYSIYYFKKVKKGKGCKIGKNVEIISPENVIIGNNVIIENFVKINARNGKVNIGDYSKLSDFSCLDALNGNIQIGNHCTINQFTILNGGGIGISIGNGVRIAPHCMIISSNHNFINTEEFIYKQGLSSKGIKIKDDVWIGAGCKILDGNTINEGCVIASNAVVTKDIPPYSVWGGVPAKLIKNR